MSPPDVPPPRVVFDRDAIATVVARLASEIEDDFPDGVVLVGVLKGALIFLADLARAMTRVPVAVDFLAISRYASGSGRVRIVHDASLDLTGRDVVVVEDIVDTGLTAAYLRGHLERIGVRRVELCTLLDRPTRRIVPIPARYVGAALDDRYVLGYGLHHDDRYRNLTGVVETERTALGGDPAGLFVQLARAAGGMRGP